MANSGDVRIVDVTGISTEPLANYDGTKYKDANGKEWIVTGKLLNSGDGKIRLYPSNNSIDTDLPASGTLTKKWSVGWGFNNYI